jgi:hypothetical protein
VERGLKVCDVETRHKSYSLEKYVERLKFVCHKKKTVRSLPLPLISFAFKYQENV